MMDRLIPVRMPIIINIRNNKCCQGCGENESLVQGWWKCISVQPLWKIVRKILKKLKTELPYDLAILLLGIYPKKGKTLTWKDACTLMFTAAVFMIAKKQKQSKYSLMAEGIRKMWYIYTMDYYSAIKGMKSCHLWQHRWILRTSYQVK